jgi:hypothetical protein
MSFVPYGGEKSRHRMKKHELFHAIGDASSKTHQKPCLYPCAKSTNGFTLGFAGTEMPGTGAAAKYAPRRRSNLDRV